MSTEFLQIFNNVVRLQHAFIRLPLVWQKPDLCINPDLHRPKSVTSEAEQGDNPIPINDRSVAIGNHLARSIQRQTSRRAGSGLAPYPIGHRGESLALHCLLPNNTHSNQDLLIKRGLA